MDQVLGHDYVDGFEYHFYRANKRYFHAIGDISARFEQAEALGNFILKGMSDLNEGYILDDHSHFEEVINFDVERLQCFRRNIGMRKAVVNTN